MQVPSIHLRLRSTILLIGDSLTQRGFGTPTESVGWAGLLAASYSRRCDVLNRGFSGNNTRHVVQQVLPDLFDNNGGGFVPSISLCTVWFGANDAALPGEPQHIPLPEYEDNLRTILTTVRQRVGETVPILVLTTPPLDEVMWANFLEIESCDRENSVARQYADCAIHLVSSLKDSRCVAIDTWDCLAGDTAEERRTFLCDGLHLSDTGNRRIFEAVIETVNTNFPDVAPRDDQNPRGIPLEGKLWDELCK